jgi:hypothetical protein
MALQGTTLRSAVRGGIALPYGRHWPLRHRSLGLLSQSHSIRMIAGWLWEQIIRKKTRAFTKVRAPGARTMKR